MRFRLLPCLVLIPLLCAAPAMAQSGSRQRATIKFSDPRPGTSTALQLGIDYRNPGNPAAKPFAVQRVLARLAPGARIDTAVPGRCDLPDAELIANGTRGCPGDSIVGNGTATFSSVDASPTTSMDITLVNNENELVYVAATSGQGGPSGRLVIRAPIRGNTITTEVPRLPAGPPDGVTAIRKVTLNIGEVSRRVGSRKLGYITTPPECPAAGAFANAGTFSYFDGITQTVPALSQCIDVAAPRVALAGFPKRGCVRRDVRARVRVDDTSPLRGVAVRLNGRKIKSTTSKRFRVRVRKARMRKGRNRLTVTAVDRRGNRFVRGLRFRRCR